MSLSLIQGYSSAEEEEEEAAATEEDEDYQNLSGEEGEEGHSGGRWKISYKAPSNGSSSSSSLLPSALDAFSQVGPPQFLSNSVEEYGVGAEHNQQQQGKHRKTWRNNNNNNSNRAVVEAKPLLVGIQERVRSDIGTREPPSSVPSTMQEGGKRAPTATNPGAEDAADLLSLFSLSHHLELRIYVDGLDMCDKRGFLLVAINCYLESGGLEFWLKTVGLEDLGLLFGLGGMDFELWMCLQCGIPKTFSNARGMVCPVCGDRPPTDASNESKKKGSIIKDKEKNKRMKGQSSHATWKSETEMQLRQQFD
ncbi:unnamed protein product [Dovyalis caffra]|uniref:Uncharacterized protein n=1 Tax=Dovyalis caffra TaxID=77055 RepID=A0AAV1ST73_9ROSI|nr:unnamed protein product [Dovyalis caffra]